jgi:methionyl-tRNA formyltransferase
MKYAFAGDRNISCKILKFLKSKGHKPLALIVSEGVNATHDQDLIDIAELDMSLVFSGNSFKEPNSIEKLKNLELDYIFGIHFPYIIPQEILSIPKVGFLNLHPGFLPYNKGWHTPSWAILDNTPFGATLHFMTEALDEGDIIHQKQIEVLPQDTAHSLYHRVLKLEEEVFYEAYENLKSLQPNRIPQVNKGTSHVKRDLHKIQEIDLSLNHKAGDLFDKLRALTTNNPSEAAFIIKNGKRIGIQLRLFDMDEE